MGLDMGLNKVTMATDELRQALNGIEGIDASKVDSVKESFAYWRKANSIHAWFVDNVQNGNDDCGTYYVTEDAMYELLDLVNEVLDASPETQKQVAKDVLPMQDGFFFGATDYGDENFGYYLEDLKYTKEILEKAVKEAEASYIIYFEYWSSW